MLGLNTGLSRTSVGVNIGPHTRVIDFSGLSLPQLASFTRAGPAIGQASWGGLERFESDHPRFMQGSEPAGLLIEPTRTNLCLYSNDLRVGWSKHAGTTVSEELYSGPDGQISASHVGFTQQYAFVYQTVPVQSGQTYTFSYFVRPETATELFFAVYDHTNFNWIIPSTQVTPANSTALGTTGWHRVEQVFSVPANTHHVRIYPGRSVTSAALGTSSIYGVQLEQAQTVSSPILTGASATTRAADQLQGTGDPAIYNIVITFADQTQQIIPAVAWAGWDISALRSDPFVVNRIALTPTR